MIEYNSLINNFVPTLYYKIPENTRTTYNNTSLIGCYNICNKNNICSGFEYDSYHNSCSVNNSQNFEPITDKKINVCNETTKKSKEVNLVQPLEMDIKNTNTLNKVENSFYNYTKNTFIKI